MVYSTHWGKTCILGQKICLTNRNAFFRFWSSVCTHGNAVGLCRSNSNATAASLYPQLPTKKRFGTVQRPTNMGMLRNFLYSSYFLIGYQIIYGWFCIHHNVFEESEDLCSSHQFSIFEGKV